MKVEFDTYRYALVNHGGVNFPIEEKITWRQVAEWVHQEDTSELIGEEGYDARAIPLSRRPIPPQVQQLIDSGQVPDLWIMTGCANPLFEIPDSPKHPSWDPYSVTVNPGVKIVTLKRYQDEVAARQLTVDDAKRSSQEKEMADSYSAYLEYVQMGMSDNAARRISGYNPIIELDRPT